MNSQNDLLTIKEVAQALRVDQETVRRWIKGGAMPAIQLPCAGEKMHYRIRRSTLASIVK